MSRLPNDHPSAGFQLASPSRRLNFTTPSRQGQVPAIAPEAAQEAPDMEAPAAPLASSSITSPGSPGTKITKLKADVLSIKETVEHIQEVFASDVAEAIATTLGNESNLKWLSKKFEDHSVALRSSFRTLELTVESVTTKLKEVTELAEETYKEAPTYSQVEALTKRMLERMQKMEAALSEIKAGAGDPEAGKKVRVLSRENESLTEEKDELTEKLRKAEKIKSKTEAELTNQKEAYKQLEREFMQFKDKQSQQHERRSKAAQDAWQKRRAGIKSSGPPNEEAIEDFDDEKPKPSAPHPFPSSSSSSSSSSAKPVPQMQVTNPYAPGGEYNKLGLGTGKAPPKPKLNLKRGRNDDDSDSDSSSAYESDYKGADHGDYVRDAWAKEQRKKAKKDKSDSE